MAWMASRRFLALAVMASSPGVEQVGVGLVVRAPDAAAQLVQLRQAEAVRAVDDDGVGRGTSMPVSMMVVHSSTLKRCW